MSRTRNKHRKNWNTPKRLAKEYGNKYRRRWGKRVAEADPETELAVDLPKNAGPGDVWAYD